MPLGLARMCRLAPMLEVKRPKSWGLTDKRLATDREVSLAERQDLDGPEVPKPEDSDRDDRLCCLCASHQPLLEQVAEDSHSWVGQDGCHLFPTQWHGQ